MSDWEKDPGMFYYSGLNLSNFRGFRKSKTIPFAPLTFLVGPNSAGKSSLFSALLLLAQSHFEALSERIHQPKWGGPLVDLGSYKDAVYKHKPTLPIKLGVEIVAPFLHRNLKKKSRTPQVEILFTFRTTQNDPIGMVKSIKLTDCLSKESINIDYSRARIAVQILDKVFDYKLKDLKRRYPKQSIFFRVGWEKRDKMFDQILNEDSPLIVGKKAALRRLQLAMQFPAWPIMEGVERVSSGRAAPRRWYSIAETAGVSKFPFIGIGLFSEVDPRMLADSPEYYYHPYYHYRRKRRKQHETIRSALEKLNIATNIQPSEISTYHTSIEIQDSITGITSNLIDVGYGASQVIPILRACMSFAAGPLFVEQPEIHLHPHAQGVLSEILCRASLDRQVVVETHSVHMINRARILVAEGKISPDHVIVNFVGKTTSGSRVHTIPILNGGDFGREWPAEYGFFDERYQDTMHLLRLKDKTASK